MNPIARTCGAALAASLSFASPPAGARAQGASQAGGDDALARTIATLDGQVFDAFNRCADPAQLQRHAEFFAADVEFYHDTGGVTWNRDDMIANTRTHACGRYTRERVPGSLRVHAVKDFGAIVQGVHRFCQAGSGRCEGEADFTMLWRHRDGRWQVTRVLSYGHRSGPAAP